MVRRSRTPRKVSNPPVIKGFRPYGLDSGKIRKPVINLLYEEYEALRLCDFDHYNHQDASEFMAVSRPTFTRIYASALRKIAEAFVEGREIFIEGGHVYFDSDWYLCKNCTCYFNNPEKEKALVNCPLCGKRQIAPADFGLTVDTEYSAGIKITYVCEQCNTEQLIPAGEIIIEQLCQLCHSTMKQKVQSGCSGLNSCL